MHSYQRVIGFALAAAAATAVSLPGVAAAQPTPPVPGIELPTGDLPTGGLPTDDVTKALEGLLGEGGVDKLAAELGKPFLDGLAGLTAEQVVALLAQQDPQRLSEITELLNQVAARQGATNVQEAMGSQGAMDSQASTGSKGIVDLGAVTGLLK